MMLHTRLIFASVAFLLGVNHVAGMRIKDKIGTYADSNANAIADSEAGLDTGCVISGDGRKLTLGKKLGQGAEGTVYEGMENGLPAAAVKLMTKINATELANLKKLTRVESQHLLRLEKGFDRVQQCCGKACVITQLIRGKDMAHIMWDNGFRTLRDEPRANKGAVSYQLLRSLILQALAAFRDTEAAGLCNYDQHLRNIMYEDGTERVVFIDFGHAMDSASCPPTGPFKPEYSDQTSVQSFRSLAPLVNDERVKAAYNALCDRMERRTYRSAAEALIKEAFADPIAQDPSEPGPFFALVKDDVIVEQLQALKDTGSPHIGRPTAPSPFGGHVEKPAPVPQQVPNIRKGPTMPLAPAKDVVATAVYVKNVECNVECGATSVATDKGRYALHTMPLAPNQCAKCGFKPACVAGVHTKIASFIGATSTTLCCRRLECSR